MQTPQYRHASAAHLGDPERELELAAGGSVVARPGHLALVAVEGEDARRFLQAQLSCDVEEVDHGATRPGAWCSPQGRVRAVMRLWSIEGVVCCELPHAQVEAVVAGLRRFVLRSRVEIGPAAGRWQPLGVSGERARDWLASQFAALPEGAGDAVEGDGLVLARLPGAERYQVYGQEPRVAELWERAAGVLAAVGAEAWRFTEIVAGVPWLGPATAERYLPQMLALEQAGGVSFTKGCYPGQEVVARTQHRGRIKRRLRVLRCPAAPEPLPGPLAPLYAGQGANSVGEVLDSVRAPGGACLLGAVVAVEAGQPGLAPGGPALEDAGDGRGASLDG